LFLDHTVLGTLGPVTGESSPIGLKGEKYAVQKPTTERYENNWSFRGEHSLCGVWMKLSFDDMLEA